MNINVTTSILVLWVLLASVASSTENPEVKFMVKPISEGGVSGELYLPGVAERSMAVVVLGGSSGRLNQVYPKILAAHGYVVLSLAYFRAPGLPETLDLIAIETVSNALDFLTEHSQVKATKFGVLAISRGTELALLNAAVEPRIEAIAVLLPSAVAWHGQTSAHAWTYQARPIPGLAFERRSETPIKQRAERALKKVDSKNASIAVEHINGPILMISAQEDHIWPSERMANLMLERLNQNNFKFKTQHHSVDDNHFLDAATVQSLELLLVDHFQ